MIIHDSIYTLRRLSPFDREGLGFVVLVMRYWPRGMRHLYNGLSIVDAWLPDAGPSRDLLYAYKHGDGRGNIFSWQAFASAYREEQLQQRGYKVITYRRQTGERLETRTCPTSSPLQFLLELEYLYGTICCVCHENLTKPDSHCHRTELLDLLEHRRCQSGAESSFVEGTSGVRDC